MWLGGRASGLLIFFRLNKFERKAEHVSKDSGPVLILARICLGIESVSCSLSLRMERTGTWIET